MELSHPSWRETGIEFCLVFQFLTVQDYSSPKVSIRALDASEDVPNKVMESLQEHIEASKGPTQLPMLYLSKYVEALKEIYN